MIPATNRRLSARKALRRPATVLMPGGLERAVRTWDVASGEPQDALALRGDNVGGVAYVGSRLLVTPFEGGLLSWKPGADEHRRMRGHAAYVYTVAVMDGGALVASGGWDARTGATGGLKLWDMPSRRLVASWGDEQALVFAVAPTPDGARVWFAAQGREPDHSNGL